MILTGRPRALSRTAARAAPLQCGPAQYTTKSICGGQAVILEAMIFPCGRLTAPATWPLRKCSGLRTSSTTNPGWPEESASWTSQQSVSNLKSCSKCASASALDAAAMAVTLFDTCRLPVKFDAACRIRPRVTIGTNAIYHRNHAKATDIAESSGGGPAARECGDVRARDRRGDLRPAKAGDGRGLVPLRHRGGGAQ